MSETEIVKAEGRISQEELKQRVEDVMELIMLGSSFPEIRQFSTNMQWNVSVRQLQRYQDKAYQRLAAMAQRNSEELLGRHLQQRRTLYAQCVRRNDCRTALQVLRDEAELNGLYPGKKGSKPVPMHSPLSLRERTLGVLIARDRGDKKQVQLLEHASPVRPYRLRDTVFPLWALEMLTLKYVCDQLSTSALVMNSGLGTLTGGGVGGGGGGGEWNGDAARGAYWYRVRFDAWQQFMQELGLEPGVLVKQFYRADVLEEFDRLLCAVAPTVEELRGVLEESEMEEAEMVTVEGMVNAWRKEFMSACGGGK